ncbi:MAG: FAD-dependent oxidoreductase [Tepidanaerobacteraceae bacterium]|jgi:2,4-dienoyl-CoA reductase-like NADH-dependent reductase (Old Yellow Enzyme family)/thioredoxin reductase|nr:FAD-dependent oxidoreductase [Thermoanaerobacterales bacterium]
MAIYPNIFKPIKIGTMEVKNRIFLAPMGTAFGEHKVHKPTERMAAYYAARAAGGTGLIIVEQSVVQQRGLWSLNGGGLWSDDFIPGWKKLVDRVHDAGGKIIIQVGHLGRSTIEAFNGGLKPVAPSAVPDHYLDNEVDELTLEDIEEFKRDFVEATIRCKKAGFDGIEIHCTHGYMLASFLSGRTNKRTDKYGGTLEGRLRLPLEIIQLVRRELGRDYPIIARLAAHEENGGRTLEETRVVAKALVEAGLDGLDISSGSYSELDWEIPPSYFGYAMNMDNIEKIKQSVDVPILASGRITEPRLAEQLIAEGRCDMVGINRAGIADPEWGKKAGAGDTESIRRCIGCVRCIDAVFSGALRCTVNPFVGKEDEIKITPAEEKKNILVVGGGPVGLESAILCARRGHKVTLVEKNYKLGGQVNSAAVPPHKYEVGSLITTQTYEAEKLGVDIITGVNVDVDFVKNSDADEVIVATGAKHIIPNIPGIDKPMVMTAVDLLEGKKHAGNRVVIIGGNMIGCETAEFLAEYGKNIFILEMLSEIGQNLALVPKPYVLSKLNRLGVEIYTEAEVTSIEDDKVIYEKEGNEYTIESVDTVVLAAGMESVNELAEELKSLDKPIHVVGDADNVDIIMEGLASVYDKLLDI